MYSFIFFGGWQDSAATMNRTLFSFTNLVCVDAFQNEGRSNRSKSSGVNLMSVIPRSISSTWGEDTWDIARGIHARVPILAKMKLSVRRSVQWDIVGKAFVLLGVHGHHGQPTGLSPEPGYDWGCTKYLPNAVPNPETRSR